MLRRGVRAEDIRKSSLGLFVKPGISLIAAIMAFEKWLRAQRIRDISMH